MNLSITLKFYLVVLEYIVNNSFDRPFLQDKAQKLIEEIENLPDKTK